MPPQDVIARTPRLLGVLDTAYRDLVNACAYKSGFEVDTTNTEDAAAKIEAAHGRYSAILVTPQTIEFAFSELNIDGTPVVLLDTEKSPDVFSCTSNVEEELLGRVAAHIDLGDKYPRLRFSEGLQTVVYRE